MTIYLAMLQQPNGLFFHAPDVKFYWGRGNGWFAAGMAEMLTSLASNDPQYPMILAGYRKMMAALLVMQPKDGVWRQLVDNDASWAESSATGMFTFAMAEGIRMGWLDKAVYGPAVYRAWIGVSGLIDQDYKVTSVCEGTNKGNSLTYYLQRRRRTGDLHGQRRLGLPWDVKKLHCGDGDQFNPLLLSHLDNIQAVPQNALCQLKNARMISEQNRLDSRRWRPDSTNSRQDAVVIPGG